MTKKTLTVCVKNNKRNVESLEWIPRTGIPVKNTILKKKTLKVQPLGNTPK